MRTAVARGIEFMRERPSRQLCDSGRNVEIPSPPDDRVGALALVIASVCAHHAAIWIMAMGGFGIPLAFVLGWFFYDEAPRSELFPGALLIIASGLIIVWRERRLRPVR